MIMAMIKIHRLTGKRELLWTLDTNKIDVDEEVKAARTFYGTAYAFAFELVG